MFETDIEKLDLTKNQAKIYRLMVHRPDKVWEVEDIANAIYGFDKPKSWVTAVRQIMIWVITKTKFAKYRVERVSSLGRGNVAKYAIVKQGD